MAKGHNELGESSVSRDGCQELLLLRLRLLLVKSLWVFFSPRNNLSHLKLSESVEIFPIDDLVGESDSPDTLPQKVVRFDGQILS